MTVVTVTCILLTYGIVYGDVSLESNSYGHEDGCAHGDTLQWVEQVGKDDDVELVVNVEATPETLQHRTEQVPRVDAKQAYQQQVKRVAHIIPAMRNLTMFNLVCSG